MTDSNTVKNNSVKNDAVKNNVQDFYRQLVKAIGLQPRWGQKQMIAAITRHLLSIKEDDTGQRLGETPACVIEAGTGTGKTLAYIVAALPVALELEKKLLISTATIALQEQIMFQDLPAINAHGNRPFTFCLAKGRSRYLCVARLHSALTNDQATQVNQALFEDELALQLDAEQKTLYQSLQHAFDTDKWSGDRDLWQESIDETHWRAVTNDHRGCTNRRCHYFDQCPFFKARSQLDKADCIVANHDLVLADLQLGGGAILPKPEDTIYVFDEGHHLAGKALQQFTRKVSIRQLSKWYAQVNTGLKRLNKDWQGGQRVSQLCLQLQEPLTSLDSEVIDLEPLLNQQRINPTQVNSVNNTYVSDDIYRFANGLVPEELRDKAAKLALTTQQIEKLFTSLHDQINAVIKQEQTGLEADVAEMYLALIGRWLSQAVQQKQLWQIYATQDSEWRSIEASSKQIKPAPHVRWIKYWHTPERMDIELAASPMLANQLLHDNLWQTCFAAVITSATLLALGRFDQLLLHTGLPDTTLSLALASPFKYEESALCVPKEAVEPKAEEVFAQDLVHALTQNIDPTEGTLVLFTSKRLMQKVFEDLPTQLQELILLQGDTSKYRLIEQHKQCIDAGEGSIVFGLASFAEGVDLPGNYLVHVIITRLPFTVPDRPVSAALAEWIEQQGGNAFMDVSVPEASLRLIQATGRLLRTETDKGRITVLDRRLISKRYGKSLMASLPPYQQNFAGEA